MSIKSASQVFYTRALIKRLRSTEKTLITLYDKCYDSGEYEIEVLNDLFIQFAEAASARRTAQFLACSHFGVNHNG